jgi:uncharacterized protein (UPF0332 family)
LPCILALVNEQVEPYLSKARECLAGAHSELANGRYNNAANRAYYAAYNAAIVALIRAGVTRPRWSHEDVQSLFAGQLIARRKLYPAAFRSTLPDLITIRLRGDYGQREASQRDASNAVNDAERLLRAVVRIEL